MNFIYYLQELENILLQGSERSHYPTLKTLIDTAMLGINAVIEEKGNQAGIPDFTVRKNNKILGYIEAKKIGENLDNIEETEQLKRYFEYAIGQNLILTNYLEFRWYKEGKLELKSTIGKIQNNKVIATKEEDKLNELITSFLKNQGKVINNYNELASAMAKVTKTLRYSIEEALKIDTEKGELTELKSVFQDLLLPDLDNDNFADMYAQTIAYGLFTARIGHSESEEKSPPTSLTKEGVEDGGITLHKKKKILSISLDKKKESSPTLLDNNKESSPTLLDKKKESSPTLLDKKKESSPTLLDNKKESPPTPLSKGGVISGGFNRENAGYYISDKIPFLKGLFDTVISKNIVSKIHWTIDILIELLAEVDMDNILANFGQETQKEDPVVHFYETFLAAYSSNLRKTRGVYYTPEPVVSFIVKAVNDILETDFHLDDGLGSKNVTILDPATGTGTFLYEVIKQIYHNFSRYGVNNWHELLKRKNVLNRLYGFELLMTPYTIAHLKLGLLLKILGYRFEDKERLNIFLTNALDEGVKKSELLLAKYISQEANQAAEVKAKTPIHVVIGNPPYSGHSANKNSWIDTFVKDYYEIDGLPLNEKNSKWLQDDYVKFIRFGENQIEKTGAGILAFVTNHGYLDNPTFRGMRQHLMKSFNRLYLLNLHGNSKKKEVSPDGSADKNVFDIQQGVSILIAVKDIPEEKVFFKAENYQVKNGIFYYDLWGSRENKYQQLKELTIETINWETVNPQSPFYLFTPQDTFLLAEYNQGYKITDIMPINSVGIVTARDKLTIHDTIENVEKVVNDFVSLTEEEAREKYDLGKDSEDWKISLAQKDIKDSKIDSKLIKPILYRPFDFKYTYYTGKSSGFICRSRNNVMRNMLVGENLGLITVRQVAEGIFDHVLVSQNIIESRMTISNKGMGYLFPLYIYPDEKNGQTTTQTKKLANFSPEFITTITEKLGYTPTPEKIFYYLYAILHSPNYRQRYSQFLKIDFPRIPLTSSQDLFNQLAEKGEALVNLHLLKILPDIKLTRSQFLAKENLPIFQKEKGEFHYQGDGNNKVTQVKYDENKQQLFINKDCYFMGINKKIWEFRIGGYQVLEKWLKDRQKANICLSESDIIHYQKMILAITETMKTMIAIDKIIPQFPFP